MGFTVLSENFLYSFLHSLVELLEITLCPKILKHMKTRPKEGATENQLSPYTQQKTSFLLRTWSGNHSRSYRNVTFCLSAGNVNFSQWRYLFHKSFPLILIIIIGPQRKNSCLLTFRATPIAMKTQQTSSTVYKEGYSKKVNFGTLNC